MAKRRKKSRRKSRRKFTDIAINIKDLRFDTVEYEYYLMNRTEAESNRIIILFMSFYPYFSLANSSNISL